MSNVNGIASKPRVLRLAAILFRCCACGLLVLASCLTQKGGRPTQPAPAEASRIEVRQKFDHVTGKLLREWSLRVYPDRPPVKHGVEHTYHPNGNKEWERSFAEGKPAGAWRSWYENGKPRSESFFNDPPSQSVMTFWHPNGQISMQGPAVNGVRGGKWKVWYANGQLAEQGEFRDSLREGKWLAWSENGTKRFERMYKHNVRTAETPLAPDAPADASAPNAPGATPKPNALPHAGAPGAGTDETTKEPPHLP